MLRAACVLCVILPMLAHAANPAPAVNTWGVVVGVSEYPQLGPSVTLEGPRNDIPLVMTWLARASVPRNRITVLADHVAGADGLPTRTAILAALDAVAVRATSGDIVFLYFAGHGSQVPQTDAGDHAKADGLEQVFLPRDAGQMECAPAPDHRCHPGTRIRSASRGDARPRSFRLAGFRQLSLGDNVAQRGAVGFQGASAPGGNARHSAAHSRA